MKNFQEKNNNIYKRVVRSRPFLFLLFFIIVIFTYGSFSLFSKMKDTIRNRSLAEEKLNELQNRKEKLISDIDNLNTEKGKEKIFRESFGLAKEGEGVIVILDEEQENDFKNTQKSSFFSKILDLFR